MDNDEVDKDDGAAKWQAGAAQTLEEDDEDNVVNSPQDISTRVHPYFHPWNPLRRFAITPYVCKSTACETV